MINIKDIARMTNLSTTTVSKVINNKVDDLSEETVKKVLKVVKEYNYMPYKTILNNKSSKSFTIAYITKNLTKSLLILTGILDVFNSEGYSLLIYDSQNSIETENLNLSKLSNQNIDGLIWEPVDLNNSEYHEKIIKQNNYKILYINSYEQKIDNFYIDYEKMAYIATQKLIDYKHKRIACVYKSDSLRGMETLKGYKRCLMDNSISYFKEITFDDNDLNFNVSMFGSSTAILTSHFTAADNIRRYFNNQNIFFPEDISLVSMMNQIRSSVEEPDISTIKIPNKDFGRFVGRKIVQLCELNRIEEKKFVKDYLITNDITIDIPKDIRESKAIVIGGINVENIVHIDKSLEKVSSQYADNMLTIPGGKALNQAIGIKLLEKNVELIGRIGSDEASDLILKTLEDYGINDKHITIDKSTKTASSIVVTKKTGEYSTIVTKGANDFISKEFFFKNDNLFNNTSFCIVNTEIPMESVSEILKICKLKKVKTILQPSTITNIPNRDYKNIDILFLTSFEAKVLTKENIIENQFKYFSSKKIKIIIISLGSEGIYLKVNDEIKFFKSKQHSVVDESSYNDAFLSAFCARLMDNYSVYEAANSAIIAANYSISKMGSFDSLIDLKTLNRIESTR